ncbi:MAG: hypothetical protein B6D56_08080 [Candidatus Omnitrophica bacterium 4484_70.1]|nr:MAG: hypothetical protein B6D56_08080 [Candidatus Omnitrophica bacterium 4484_70.1]
MKILFVYFPHYSREKGYFLLSQNRFAKYRGTPELIYPLIPASMLTLLKKGGFNVNYLDCIAKKLSWNTFLEYLYKLAPDVIIYESKTPSVKKDWDFVNRIKEIFPKTILIGCGDHLSVLPEETLRNSKTDYIVLGGDYDYGVFQLCKYLCGKEKFPQGVAYRNLKGEIKNDNNPLFLSNLDELPIIDRDIIPWRDYHEAWRLYDEFMYIYGSRGCPYRCTFCSWPQMLYRGKVRFRSPENIVTEIELLINKYNVKEIFFDDDTFTCNRKWVMEICNLIKDKKLNILWGCNGRVDNVDEEMLKCMKESGCRFIKYGVESANQKTLDRIKKGYTIQQVIGSFKITQKVGIQIHATAMLGFPWETKREMLETIEFIKRLKPDTCQFSIPVPYPGTELFQEGKEKGWLSFGENWEKYDMSLPPLKNQFVSPQEIVHLCRKAWIKVYFSPSFIIRKLKNLRNFLYLRLYFRGIISVLRGHLNLKLFKK